VILKKLEIERIQWGADKGQFKGVIQFENDQGSVVLNLSPARCEQLFAVVADGIVETAKEAAHNLTCNVIEHQKLIEESQ
jgi:hypothetical protein